MERGLQEGRQEGPGELLLRLGELPAAVGERIATAQLPELDRRAEQRLVAVDLDEVLSESRAGRSRPGVRGLAGDQEP